MLPYYVQQQPLDEEAFYDVFSDKGLVKYQESQSWETTKVADLLVDDGQIKILL